VSSPGGPPSIRPRRSAISAPVAGTSMRTETDRGTWVQALLAAGYQVYAINPMSVKLLTRGHQSLI
jgi:hypothetical protein